MAENIFKHMAAGDDELNRRFTAGSAGLSAVEGVPASPDAVKALSDEWGIDMSLHRSRNVGEGEIKNADLILTMTREHREAVIAMFPEAGTRVFTLKEYAADEKKDPGFEEYNFALDIVDPYGMPVQVYKRCAGEIKEAVERLITKLRNAPNSKDFF